VVDGEKPMAGRLGRERLARASNAIYGAEADIGRVISRLQDHGIPTLRWRVRGGYEMMRAVIVGKWGGKKTKEISGHCSGHAGGGGGGLKKERGSACSSFHAKKSVQIPTDPIG